MARRALLVTLLSLLLVIPLGSIAEQEPRPTLYWGSSGDAVRTLQSRLSQWGYYRGAVDGFFGAGTSEAVRSFQAKNGLTADGLVGPATWSALGLGGSVPASTPTAAPVAFGSSTENLLSRLVAAEARSEPYAGQVAVAAVILNRVADPRFPNSLPGVVYQPHAFESVSNGLVWRRAPNAQELRAAREALAGWDPSYGSVFFWNPSKPVSPWIWTRSIIARIGSHVFAK